MMNENAKMPVMNTASPHLDNHVPKVSVTVVTYNHGKWLADCLDSILTQKTNFLFEVIVGDDASTDGVTKDILLEYSKKYPEIVIPVFRESNVGPTNNYFDVVSRVRGEYVSHIDGDDQMLPGKLQRAADILDASPALSMVVHDMRLMPQSGEHKKIGLEFKTIDDLLLQGCFFCHSSKTYRANSIITKHSSLPLVDYYLHIEHARSGGICVVHEELGVHRLHAAGISKSPAYSDRIANAYDLAFDRALELGVPHSVVMKGRLRYRMAKGLTCLNARDYESFKKYANFDDEFNQFASFGYLLLKKFRAMCHFIRLVYLFRRLVFRITSLRLWWR